MKALVLQEHGGNDKFHLETAFPTPAIGPDDVLIKVSASSINYHDIFTRRGMPGIKLKFPIIIGIDVAGIITEVGDNVTDWKVGDRVLVDPPNRVDGGLLGETTFGGFAEYCKVPAHQLVSIPENVDIDEAAALPVAYGTAYRMVRTIGQIKAGERVLILGASGGVGICAVQLAKLAGATVIACAGSQDKANKLKELGADDVILYNEVDFLTDIRERYGRPSRSKNGPQGGVDVVINFTGGDTWVKSLRTLRLGGRLLTCGATAGFDPKEDIRYIWSFELQIRGSNGWQREELLDLLKLVADKKLKVPIDKKWSLDQGAEAVASLENRQVFGKVIVKP